MNLKNVQDFAKAKNGLLSLITIVTALGSILVGLKREGALLCAGLWIIAGVTATLATYGRGASTGKVVGTGAAYLGILIMPLAPLAGLVMAAVGLPLQLGILKLKSDN